MKKKLISMLLCAAMSTMLLGVGVQAEESANTIDLRAYEGTTITLAHGQGEYAYGYFYEFAEKFEELTGIKVEIMEIPSGDYNTWLTAQFAAGTEPDILFSGFSPAQFNEGKLADLTKYYEYTNPFNDTVWLDCFEAGTMDDCIAEDGVSYYATGLQKTGTYLYYNKTIMEELGLGTEAPETISEMIEMLKVCKEDGRYVPMSAMNGTQWNFSWMYGEYLPEVFYGSEELAKLDIIIPNGKLDSCEAMLGWKTGVLSATDPRCVEIFDLIKEVTQYCNEDFNATTWEYEALFNEGKAMFNYNGSWFPGQFAVTEYDVNYGVAAFPYYDSSYSAEYGLDEAIGWQSSKAERMFGITKKCEDEGRLEAAVLFDMFMTDYNTGAQMYVDRIMQPSNVIGVTYPAECEGFAAVKAGDAVKNNATTITGFSSEASTTFWEDFNEYLDPSSTETAEEFAARVTEDLEELVDEAIEDYTVYDVLSYVDDVQ